MSQPPALSSRLKGLRFMQRAQHKAQKQQEEQQADRNDAEVRGGPRPPRAGGVAVTSRPPRPRICLTAIVCMPQAHWVAEGARTQCVVIAEGDPQPGDVAAGGRMRFLAPGSEQQAAVAETGGGEGPDGCKGGVSVSDEAMAASLKRKARHDDDKGEKQQRQGEGRGKAASKQRSRYF